MNETQQAYLERRGAWYPDHAEVCFYSVRFVTKPDRFLNGGRSDDVIFNLSQPLTNVNVRCSMQTAFCDGNCKRGLDVSVSLTAAEKRNGNISL